MSGLFLDVHEGAIQPHCHDKIKINNVLCLVFKNNKTLKLPLVEVGIASSSTFGGPKNGQNDYKQFV